MIKRFIILILAFQLILISALKADEGMWIPMLLGKYNIADMKAKGFKLSAEDIYSVNKASMKDAVLIFGGGCTGEMISDEGLLITNHHCGYSAIQSHSSLEHDYLTDGFWAMSRNEELVNAGLKATFLIRMEDVTDKVMKDITDEMSGAKRETKIADAIKKIVKKAIEGTHYKASVKPFFSGNQYFLFVSEVFKDVRLVGAPPSAIGKFGGDTDNWMWPRHTGDFSLFRIYANKENNPADYSPDNVPYKPKKSFPISLKGVKKGDFTMVFGYPGRTQEYLTSYAVDMISKVENPHQIRIRQKKIDIMKVGMDSDPKIRIQYSAKYARVSNYWKKWIGENRGLKKLHALDKKREVEARFTKWANSTAERKEKYGYLLDEYKKLYEKLTPLALAEDYVFEAGLSLDIAKLGKRFITLSGYTKETETEAVKEEVEALSNYLKGFFKDYNIEVDKKIFAAMLKIWTEHLDIEFQPEIIKVIKTEFDGNYEGFTETYYNNSILLNNEKAAPFVENFTIDDIEDLIGDPAIIFYHSITTLYFDKIKAEKKKIDGKIKKLNKIWMQGLMEMDKDKVFYPDANSTLRVAFGIVDDYIPNDAVEYDYYTTLEGIMEKDDPEVYDYKVPAKLKQLYQNKDYGKYAEDGKIHVCFIASNHTTGGNSGSPVLNAEGHLIGVNFDRNWEGTMSDIMYDPDQCRNISIDIRYALFLIDKFAGATHLIKEMKIIE